jgi:hypothetical protein
MDNVSPEIIYCHYQACLAREKADTASTEKSRDDHLSAEARWLALARSHQLQLRLSRMLGETQPTTGTGPTVRTANGGTYAFDPDVVAIISSVFRAVVIDLALSAKDERVALRVAKRIIELVAAGEKDPKRLIAATLNWVTK